MWVNNFILLKEQHELRIIENRVLKRICETNMDEYWLESQKEGDH
jgi:hypothetical protein